jgi:hypothetical protein
MAQAHHGPTEYSLEDPLTRETLSDDDDFVNDELDIHLASIREKKRLWWRNAGINAFFIGAW